MTDPVPRLSPPLATPGAPPGQPPGRGDGAPAANFRALLEQTLRDAAETGRRGEAVATQAVAGNASLQEVVEAVNAAEIALQTVVAVRDRMIAAYQEIVRMPI